MDLLQSGLASQDLSHHVGVGGVVGGQVDGTAGLQDVHEGLDELLTHEPALVVPGFRPRVREEHEHLAQAGCRKSPGDQVEGIAVQYAQVGQITLRDEQKCPRDAFAVDVGGDVVAVWILLPNCRAVSPSPDPISRIFGALRP